MTLKQRREAVRLTQKEAAARLRINRSTIAHWELGRNGPSKRIIHRVAELYGCSIEDLLGESKQPPLEAEERK